MIVTGVFVGRESNICRVSFKGTKGEVPLRKFRSPFQIVSERLGREGGISPFQIYFGAHFQSIRYSDSIVIVNQILVINQRCWR